MNTADQAEALKAEGNKLASQRNWAAAAKRYKKAINIDGSVAVYWSNLALCYDKMGCLDEYKYAAKKTIEVDPHFLKGYIRLANAHHRLFEFELEKETLEKGLEVYPDNSDMKKMMVNVMIEIAMREKFHEVLCTVPDEDPLLLGGVPTDNGEIREELGSLQASNPSFFSLKRSALPPISKKHKDTSKFNEGVRPVIESFYNGEVKAKWTISSSRGALIVEGYLPSESVPVTICSLYPRTGIKHQTEQHTTYHNILTLEERRGLGLVLMHRVLREHGFHLGKELHENILFGLVVELSKNYTCLKRYKDSVDVRLTFADMAVGRKILGLTDFTDFSYCGGNSAIAHLGEELEAAKMYRQAGAVYAELCEGHLFNQHEKLGKAQLYTYAGLAFKRDQDFVNAEAHYFAALREEGNNFQRGSHNHASHVLENMMTFYRIVTHEVLSGLKTDDVHNTMQRAHLVLTGLLSVARCQPEGNDTIALGVSSAVLEGALKQAYKNRHKAFKAVQRAFTASSIDEYHERLFSCQNGREISLRMAVPADKAEMQADLLKHQNDVSKEYARGTTSRGHAIQTDWECNGCKKVSNETVKRCPCLTVAYCSKECQTGHWPVHKLTCPNRKKNKK